MHRLEQPQRAEPQYDSRIWDVDDEAKAALSFNTPKKLEAPLALVAKRSTPRGHNTSPKKQAATAMTGSLPPKVSGPGLEGTKKARISQSPNTKALNPYQVLAEDVDEVTAPGEHDVQEIHDSKSSEEEESAEDSSAQEGDKQRPGLSDDVNGRTQPSEDLNISYGTIPDDADSFVDSLADVQLFPDSPEQKRTPTENAMSEAAGTSNDINNEFPVSEAQDTALQMREIAAVTLQRIAETQNELKRMRVDSPPKTSKSAKPDAGKRADTGNET